MNDVFDEDLMKELGIDPQSFKDEQADAAKKTPRPVTAKPAASMPADDEVTDGVKVQPKNPVPPVRPKAAAPENDSKPKVAPPQGAVPAKPPGPAPAKPVPENHGQEARQEVVSDDIPINLAAVMARKSIKLKDVLDLKVGEVMEFKKLPQDPIDLVANGKLIAKAELVLVDGKIGVRIVKLM